MRVQRGEKGHARFIKEERKVGTTAERVERRGPQPTAREKRGEEERRREGDVKRG